MRDYPIKLTAGVVQQIVTKGDYFHVIKASNELQLSFDSGAYIKRQQGMGGTAEYQNVSILSEADQEITLALGYGSVTDSRAITTSGGGGDGGDVGIIVANASPVNTDVTIPAETTTRIIAPNTGRRSVSVFAGEENIANLRIGCNDSIGAGQGGFLAPAGNGTLETTTGVWVYNPHSEAQTVSVIELTVV